MSRAHSMQNLPTAGRWSIYIALAVTFAIACAFLSDWQFSRNDERARGLALVEANYDAAPVPLETVIPEGSTLQETDRWQPVEVVGEYLSAEQISVRNRAHGGSSAFEVLVPFRTNDGRILIIDRGWVPPASTGSSPGEIPAAPTGTVTVVARLLPGEPLPPSGRSAPDGQVPTIHLETIAQLSSAPDRVERSAYGLMASETPAPATAPQALEAPSNDPGPHLSYAIQWVLFAVMGFVFIGYVIRTEIRHRKEDAGETVRVTRRRDRDADDEDALIDAAEERQASSTRST